MFAWWQRNLEEKEDLEESSWDAENVLVMMMVIQFWEYSKNSRATFFKIGTLCGA